MVDYSIFMFKDSKWQVLYDKCIEKSMVVCNLYVKQGFSEERAMHVKLVDKWTSVSMVSTLFMEIGYQLCIYLFFILCAYRQCVHTDIF